MATLRAPGAPVTSASPLVIMTASTLPAANASIDGAYSNQANSTSTPASLNQPFWMPTSNAVQPGQSEKPIRSGPFATPLSAGAAFAAGGARSPRLELRDTVASATKPAEIARMFLIGAG